MLTSYIIDTDLKSYSPLISRFLYSTQADYSTQITLAAKLVDLDLQSKGVDTRLVYTSNDLQTAYDVNNNNSRITQTVVTTNTSATGSANYGLGYKRFGIIISGFNQTGSATFTLEGSNYTDITAIPVTDWTTITTLGINSTSGSSGTYTTVFDENYKNIRYRFSNSASSTFTYSVFAQDTRLDELITVKALQLIMQDFRMSEGDIWDIRQRDYGTIYDQLSNVPFLTDTDESGKTTVGDSVDSAGTLLFY